MLKQNTKNFNSTQECPVDRFTIKTILMSHKRGQSQKGSVIKGVLIEETSLHVYLINVKRNKL